LLEAAEWDAARSAYEAALAVDESAEALDGCGLALWFLGELEQGQALRERAVAGYLHDGDRDRAARVAVWISRQYLISGQASVASGWLGRAERAVNEAPGCAGCGWVAVERARRAASVEECAVLARQALEIAREHDDGDLEVFALSVLGRAEVSAGRLDVGSLKLEEAMAAATAGRVRNVHTLGEAYCNLIIAATAAGDWQRATEWCEHVDEFADQRGMTVLVGACRTVHADVLVATGRWSEAERALEDALVAHARRYPAMAAPAMAALALLRIRQGRLAEAEHLLAGREELPASLLALAELRLAEDEPRLAVALLERGLSAAHGDAIGRARLLAPLVDAFLAAGEPQRARAASREIDDIAEASGRAFVRATAQLASARVVRSEGRAREAQEHARSALEGFGALAMPHELAEARLELARALVDDLPGLAREEAQAAIAVFKRLGSSRAADAAAAFLRELGGGTGPGAACAGELTAREREVLALVARGMTNARIAETLFISEKTAGHHVSRILSKLGVRNRAQAATYAGRIGRDGGVE
jgi:DNA-binding CsgD family transcriptional regulator